MAEAQQSFLDAADYSDDPDYRKWQSTRTALIGKIRCYPGVCGYLSKLAQYGADPEEVLNWLSFAVVDQNPFRDAIRREQRNQRGLKRRLVKLADDIEKSVNSPLSYCGTWFGLLSPGLFSEEMLRERKPGGLLLIILSGMKSYASTCEGNAVQLGKLLRTKSATAKKTYVLHLLLRVKAATGKCRFPILADLLDAAYSASGHKAGMYSAESLRQIWKRDKQKHTCTKKVMSTLFILR